MIKYVELTAPEASAYRQAKIISFACKEGDYIKKGDPLFIVLSGKRQLELPSTRDGKIVEFIVSEQENINLATPLVLLETEVATSTANKPKGDNKQEQAVETNSTVKSQAEKSKKATNKNRKKEIEQQSLDLSPGLMSTESQQPSAADNKENQVPETHQETETKAMSENNVLTIAVPDIGADSAKVIEILVSVGDHISAEDPIVTLESDKASMDVPCPQSGLVKAISIAIDQDVSEGDLLIELEVAESTLSTSLAPNSSDEDSKGETSSTEKVSTEASSQANELVPVSIPDIGGDSAKVVEILVTVGDEVSIDDSLITLESDKASMDVPSTVAGVISSIQVSVDDEVTEGTTIAMVTSTITTSSSSVTSKSVETPSPTTEKAGTSSTPSPTPGVAPSTTNNTQATAPANSPSHASPSVRRYARELGVDLSKVKGSGRKNRIVHEDVKAFVKGVLTNIPSQSSHSLTGSGIPEVPAQDFSKYGEIEVSPLNKIKRVTATNLHRSWLNVPHVTHNDETNISNLEEFRKQLNAEYKAQKKDTKLSPLAFIVKAVVNALQAYPQFNSSLEQGGENLILKKYFHIGIAVDTPNGLVVPVIRNADTKSVAQLAKEMGELAQKARDKKLTMNDMSGACFTISSLGGIGGTSFTPIVNTPEVAILGVARSQVKPVWNGAEFIPGMMLPLSLSYDHRVIDGAEAARFTRHIAAVLEDVRRLTI